MKIKDDDVDVDVDENNFQASIKLKSKSACLSTSLSDPHSDMALGYIANILALKASAIEGKPACKG